jgi:modulator of FtsH protease
MTADVMQGWTNFLDSELGAAAALTGLLFVAVAINLARILQFSRLPTRAAEAPLALLSVLVVTTFALIPQQSPRAHGIEIGAIGLLIWAMHTRSLVHSRKFDRQYVGFVSRFLLNQLPPLPFIVAGALLMAGWPEGVYWIVPGVLLSFAAGYIRRVGPPGRNPTLSGPAPSAYCRDNPARYALRGSRLVAQRR